MASRVSSPVIVGRMRERGALVEALARATDGRATTVLVGGDAGIGKSRLLGDLIERAGSGNAIVLRGACVSLGDQEGLPFAPIAEALRNLRRDLGRGAIDALMDPATAELASLVPELGDHAQLVHPGHRPDWAQTRVFEGMVTLLGRLAETAVVVLVIEDLHWADRSTRDLIAFLSRSLATERVAIVASFRSDELHRRHPLRPWLAEMDRSPDVLRLQVEPLPIEDVARQVEAITDRATDVAAIDAIARRSAGNPFFVEELLAAGATAADDQLPGSLRDLLLVRVHALSDTTQAVLACAAVAGVSFDHDLLTAPGEASEADVTDAIREAIAAQLVVSDADSGTYAFRHALLQEAVYDDVLPRDRRRYHARFAEALAARDVPDGAAGASQLASLAHHASEAHELPLALRGWVDAARASARVHALAESADAYERAMGLWDAVPEDDRPAGIALVDILTEAAAACVGAGYLRRAREIAERATHLVSPADDPMHAALLHERYARILWLNGDLTSALEVLDEAVDMTRGLAPTPESARVVASLAGTLVLRDHNRRAIEVGREAVALARSIDDLSSEAYALCGLGTALVNQGDCSEGLAMLRRAKQIGTEIELSPYDFHRAYANLSSCLESCGDLNEAVAIALEGVDWARRQGLWRLQGAFLESNAASSLVHLGRWDAARELLDRRDRPISEGVARLNHAIVAGPLAIRTGRLGVARRLLVEAREDARDLTDGQLTGPIMVGLVELAIADGRPRDVGPLVDRAIEQMGEVEEVGTRYRLELDHLALRADRLAIAEARSAKDHDLEVALQADADARIADARGCADRIGGPEGGIKSEALGFMAMAEAEFAGLAGRPDPGAWASAAAIWASLGRPWPLAQCRVGEAEAILATRRSRSDAVAPLGEARTIARSLGAVPLVDWCDTIARMARLDLDADPGDVAPADERGDLAAGTTSVVTDPGAAAFGLTPRELEVLRLLVAGYSNRQIGSTMYISESTAGVHVSNILGKLGVSGRVEAAAVAIRAGLAD